MPTLEKRWQIAPVLTPEAKHNLEAFSPAMQQLLFNRGISTHEAAQAFLMADMPAYDLYSLSGMSAAVERVEAALSANEEIVVYGDYDTDGVTACVLLVSALKAMKANVRAYIPDRFEEGYGLNAEALTEIKNSGAGLVITVDCGIRAVPEAEHAQAIGLDLIITDHHTPGPVVPPAVAVINAKLEGDSYPEKNLAGVGTAFKLAVALLEKHPSGEVTPTHLLDLVAIGTIADLVPLVGENRAMVKLGLRVLRRPHRQGVMSLLGVAGVQPAQLQASHIGFSIGPRLNAAGRLASAMDAYELLMAEDVFEAGRLAQDLDNRNRERQRITREMSDKAEQMALEGDPEANLIFAADESFNMGVVGLAASRLADQYYRPAIVAHHGEEFMRASCRSIPEFHITHALDDCADLLEHFGGHAAAAGFTVRNENAEALVKRLKMIANKQLKDKDLRPVLQADLEVQLNQLNADLLRDLDRLQPTGYGNPEAAFVARKLNVKSSRTVGSDGSHLKMTVSDGWVLMDAIAFRMGHWYGNLPEQIDLLFNFEINEFQGRKNFQLNVRDIKPSLA
jgi:single-stranded-DNA-specific exonuclease